MVRVSLVEDNELSASGFLSNGANICTLRLKNSKMNREGLHYCILTSAITEGLGESDILWGGTGCKTFKGSILVSSGKIVILVKCS